MKKTDLANPDTRTRWKAAHLYVLAAAWTAACGLFPDFGHLQGRAESHDAGPDPARADANAPDAHTPSDASHTRHRSDASRADGQAPKPKTGCTGLGSPAKLKAPTPATSAGFGSILATDGEVLVAVAPMEGAASTNIPEDIEPDIECPVRQLASTTLGAIYAYAREGNDWLGGRLEVDGEGLITRAISGATVSDNNVFALNNFALTSVELNDRWIIIGEGGDAANSKGGSVSFFERSRPFKQLFKLVETRTSFGDGFGYSFALTGDTLVVGAPQSSDGSVPVGAVFVYEMHDLDITFVKKINSPHPHEGGLFGARVALSDDWIVVGAPNEPGTDDFGGSYGVGAAYAFPRSGGGRPQTLPVNGMLDKVFGTSLAVDGNTLLVGAPGSSGCAKGPQYDAAGAIHHYELDAGVWLEVECISPNSVQSGFFGYTMALTADRLAVGAPFSWNGEPPVMGMYKRAEEQRYGASAGLVYLFDRSPGHFRETCTLVAPREKACDTFGEDVSIGKGVLAVGAFGDDGEEDTVMDSGAVFLYPLSPVTP